MQTRQRGKAKESQNATQQQQGQGKPKGPYTDRFLQSIIVTLLILPYAVLGIYHGPRDFIKVMMNGINEIHSGDLKIIPSHATDQIKLVAVLASLSTPHVFYYILWTNPKIWLSFCKRFHLGRPVKAFSTAAHIIKVQQAVCFLVWYVDAVGIAFPESIPALIQQFVDFLVNMNIAKLILAVELILLGQLFNGGVYSAIGEPGVYYGVKFGEPVPWVFGFPFSVLAHPQYRGATISIWGFVVLLATEVSIGKGIYCIGCMLSVYYYVSGYVEEFL